MKTRLTIAGIILALLLTAAFLYHRYLAVYHGFKPQRFSQAAWLSASPEERGYMLDDLKAKHKLRGMTQEEVLALLGSPDHVTTVAEMHKKWASDHTPEELSSLFGEPVTGRLYAVDYDVGYMGGNPNALMVFSYSFHLTFSNGVVTEHHVMD